ncbi:hypothetical protein EMIHUDRAFT_199199 [Emiliania huxleyi CCMP1516]|uniref:Apple domain-containing protein n=2 Tax=Emiliania huxleyi TaxID=2903 RepID=A0A0D3I2G4_EMIH1|nr:hypothetical protein EMIHUDRAFT_199199 [Emiliania huxleyi CCMP1516]EOD05449.1 hypothetical protein EMIHUDRAFT_199199 [Emiliania huxleyi CCMP1516]|eukprot:XP_005757878.1 hypothetical protein EMIHUDRAFT_199199 [Emiliania huxleyi CCMP1516]
MAPQCMHEMGPGHCPTGYYAGWDASIATEELCKAQCLAEDECMFASLKVGHTCSRYNSNAGNCDPLIGTDHTTWAKQGCSGAVWARTPSLHVHLSTTLDEPSDNEAWGLQDVATVHGLSAFTLEFTFRLHANPYDYHAERTILRIGRDNGQTNSHHQFGYRLPLVGVRNFDGGSSHSPVMYVDHLNEYELSHDQRRVEFPLPFYSPPPLPPASPQPPVAPGWTVASVDTFPGATGWASNRRLDVTHCGVHGSMLGGHGVFGGGAYIEKTFDLSGVRESGDPPHARVRIELTFFAIDS